MRNHLTAVTLALLVACTGMTAISVQAQAQTTTATIVRVTNAYLATLDSAQRRRTLFAYDDEKQRALWSNLPTSIVPRSGVKFGDMNAAQRAAAMTLLSTALSARGFEKMQQIMEADEVLKDGERRNVRFGKDEYYFSILGTPSEQTPWMLQFGGHHLALNLTIHGAQGILTPSFTGAQPGTYTVNGITYRPLGQESDKAVLLLNALDDTQRAQAVLSFRVADLVLGPGKDGRTIQPEGLRVSTLNAKQKALLMDVIAEWAGIVHQRAANARLAELQADLDQTWFAWSGPTNGVVGTNIAAYYRIQGPRVIIEYSPQQMGGDVANHIHAMYRDPTNDYGRKPAKP